MENGPNRNLIRTNTGVQDSLLHNPKQSLFAYQAPMTCGNHINESIVFRPLNTTTKYGSTVTWEFSKVADLMGPLTLVTNHAPLAQPAVPPGAGENYTAIRYINNLGAGQLEYIRVTYGTNQIVTILPEWLMIRFQKFKGLTASVCAKYLAMWEWTQGERDFFASTGGEVETDLCMPFADDTSQYFSMCGMSDKLRIQIKFKAINNVLNWDKAVINGNPASPMLAAGQTDDLLRDIYIRGEMIHLTGAERDTVVANVKSSDGLAKMIEDIQAHIRHYIPPSVSANYTVRLPLTNINAPVRAIYWYLEDPKFTAGTAASNANGGDYPLHPSEDLGKQWSRYCIVAGSQTIVPWTTSVHARYYDHGRWFTGINPGQYLVGYSFSPSPEMPNASLGTLNFGLADQPTLVIEFAAGLNNLYDQVAGSTQGAYLNVIADTVNFLHEQGGDLIKTFA